jgi:hypothetical protein
MQWQIVKRIAELCYFNHDMDGWVSELWEEMNEEQRAELPQLGTQQPWIYILSAEPSFKPSLMPSLPISMISTLKIYVVS